MRANYVNETGQLFAYFDGATLHRADGQIVGTHRYDGDIVNPAGETVLIAFHEGLYSGPNRPPLAWLEASEFAS